MEEGLKCEWGNCGDDRKFVNEAELEIFDCDEIIKVKSNRVVAKKVDVKLEKFQSKRCVVEGDKESYTIKIKSGCGFDLENAIFKDLIPFGMKYINGTFKVNGKHENPQLIGRALEFKLHKILRDENILVEFDTEVL